MKIKYLEEIKSSLFPENPRRKKMEILDALDCLDLREKVRGHTEANACAAMHSFPYFRNHSVSPEGKTFEEMYGLTMDEAEMLRDKVYGR